jgi:hypothetical protein
MNRQSRDRQILIIPFAGIGAREECEFAIEGVADA